MLASPVWIALLVKLGEPNDWMLWGTLPALIQVHVKVPLTATEWTAGLTDPLCPLLKRLQPIPRRPRDPWVSYPSTRRVPPGQRPSENAES